MAVYFIDTPIRALSIFSRSVGGRKLRGSPPWSAKLTDSLPGQRVEIAKLTGAIPQAVVADNGPTAQQILSVVDRMKKS